MPFTDSVRQILSAVMVSLLFGTAWAQTPASVRIVGTIAAVRAEAGEIDVKPDKGAAVVTKLNSDSIFQRVAPGEKDLKNAQSIHASDIALGDRVLVVLNGGSNELRRMVVMPATEIAKHDAADKLDWTKRGISGLVDSKNGNEVTLKMKSFGGESKAVVIVSEATKYRRYAPDSVRFADAAGSTLAEVGIGDQLRARGKKSEDGSQVEAEEVVFGTFLTKAGSITSVDVAAGIVHINEMGTGKAITIKLTADSQLKKLPDFAAMGGGAAPMGPPRGMPGGRPPDIGQMLEHMPAAKLEDLKTGDTIVVSSTKGSKPDEITAITLLANAGMLVRMASAQSGGRTPGAGAGPGNSMGAGMSGASGGLGGLELPGMAP